MLILFDVGNTAITYGIHKGGRFLAFGSCLYDNLPKLSNNLLKKGANNHIHVIISSVVPKITIKIANSFNAKNAKIWRVGSNLSVPLKHRYPKNSKPGIDRIVNLYGGLQLYGAPLLVIDFGTAITFDYLSKAGVFEGGMIVPGPELSFQALIQRAALLPKKARLPQKAKSFLGTDTLGCLTSGVLHGYGAMTDALIERFKLLYGRNLKVVATGGFAKHLKPYTRQLKTVDPQLSVKSLLLLAKNNRLQ